MAVATPDGCPAPPLAAGRLPSHLQKAVIMQLLACRRFCRLALFLVSCVVGQAGLADEPAPARAAYPFEMNVGQFHPDVAFAARTFSGVVHVTQGGRIVYQLAGPQATPSDGARALAQGWGLTEILDGAAPLSPAAGAPAATRISRLQGPRGYRAPTSCDVALGEAWKGIRVTLGACGGSVEKVFHVAPHASPTDIRIALRGATSLRTARTGELRVGTGLGEVVYTAPVAFQMRDGQRIDVPVRYRLAETGHSYGFTLGAYDRNLPLVIDPWLQSTYVGGDAADWIMDMKLDAATGDAIVAGWSGSGNDPGGFPGATGGSLRFGGGGYDGFVARYSGDLRELKQVAFLGGAQEDVIQTLALTAAGEIVVAGYTHSSDLPGVQGKAQSALAGNKDGFVAMLPADFSSVISTYLGTAEEDEISAVAVAPSGHILVAGTTYSTGFPGVVDGAQPTSQGRAEGFVASFSADLAQHKQATYFGGEGDDRILALAVERSGDVVVAGSTNSGNLPATRDGAQPGYAGGRQDGFVARFTGDLRGFGQASYLGARGDDAIVTMSLDASGDIFVAGSTTSPDFPGVGGAAQARYAGGADGFIARLSADLRTLRQSTYLGGADQDTVNALAIQDDKLFVAGWTRSTDLPRAAGGARPNHGGGDYDGFLGLLQADLKRLDQTTYIGGSGPDSLSSLALTARGDVLAAGQSSSPDLPRATGGAKAGMDYLDAFLVLLTPDFGAARKAQVISFDPQPDQVFRPGGTFAIAPLASASSGHAITYSSASPDVCRVRGATVEIVSTGPCALVASQPGDPIEWLPAPEVQVYVAIRKAPQRITFPAQAEQTFAEGHRFVLEPPASTDSGLPLTYRSVTPEVCLISAEMVTMVRAGTCTVQARQAGDEQWLPAADAQQSIVLVATTPATPGPAPGPGPGPTPAPHPQAPTPIPTLGMSGWWALLGLVAATGMGLSRRRRESASPRI